MSAGATTAGAMAVDRKEVVADAARANFSHGSASLLADCLPIAEHLCAFTALRRPSRLEEQNPMPNMEQPTRSL